MAEGLVLNEQRRLSRRELIYYLRVIDRISGLEIGRMGDIHEEGLLLLSNAPLPVGTNYNIDIEFPKTLVAAGGKKYLSLSCKAVWSRPGPPNTSYYESGMHFLLFEDAATIMIRKLIDLFSMPVKI